MEISHVNYNNNDYTVCKIPYKDQYKLFVIDHEDLVKLNQETYNITDLIRCGNDWNHQDIGYIRKKLHFPNNTRKYLMLHNLVMDKMTFTGKGQINSVDHINRIEQDNRKGNLRFCSQRFQNYNQTKKKRAIEILNVDVNLIPKCIHLKRDKLPNGTIRERFEVVVKHENDIRIRKNTTGQSKYSLRIKLLQAIEILKNYQHQYPKIVKIYREDFQEELKLQSEFNDILMLSGYTEQIIQENLSNIQYCSEIFTGTDEEYEILLSI
jgi:hypothetical protein